MAAIGKRQRKETVSVYTVDSPTKKEFVIEEGKGTKLGDIPNGALPDVSRVPRHVRSIQHFFKNEPAARITRPAPDPHLPRPAVEFALSKIKSDDELLKLVHRSMFRTPGKATVIKKNIRAFSGFPEGFDNAKTEELFTRAFAATLNAVLDLFDLPRGVGEEGKKESKVARIMAFMEEPKASGKKDMKAAAEAKREKAAEKRERLAAKKAKLAEKKDKERAKKGGGTGRGGAKALPNDADAIKAELQAMAARQAKLLAKLEKAVEPASPPKAKAARKAADAEETPAKRAKTTVAEGAGAAAEEKQSKMPTDDALREAIADLLKGGDHETLSLKKMRADLEERFGVPLNEKKAKIKELVEAIVA